MGRKSTQNNSDVIRCYKYEELEYYKKHIQLLNKQFLMGSNYIPLHQVLYLCCICVNTKDLQPNISLNKVHSIRNSLMANAYLHSKAFFAMTMNHFTQDG